MLAFCRTFCIGAVRFRNAKYRAAKDISWVPMPNVGRAPTSYALLCVQWLNAFILSCVERLPNREVFHIPDSYTKQEIFMDYVGQQVTAGDSHVSYGYFCKLWQRDFRLVKIPKSNRFSVCQDCENIKRDLKNATTIADQGTVTPCSPPSQQVCAGPLV